MDFYHHPSLELQKDLYRMSPQGNCWKLEYLSISFDINQQAAAEYAKVLAQRQKEEREAKEQRRKRTASIRESRNSVKSQ